MLVFVRLQVFDSPEELKTKVETLAQWIKESQYMVVHSGAGISTSTGIPDFRYSSQLAEEGDKHACIDVIFKSLKTISLNGIIEVFFFVGKLV